MISINYFQREGYSRARVKDDSYGSHPRQMANVKRVLYPGWRGFNTRHQHVTRTGRGKKIHQITPATFKFLLDFRNYLSASCQVSGRFTRFCWIWTQPSQTTASQTSACFYPHEGSTWGRLNKKLVECLTKRIIEYLNRRDHSNIIPASKRYRWVL